MGKSKSQVSPSTKEFEAAINKANDESYLLRLYVAGSTPRSLRAIARIKTICEEYLFGQYVLEVIDLYQTPDHAKGDQIIAVPTLIKELPSPLRRVIGDMSSTERLLIGLDIKPMKKK